MSQAPHPYESPAHEPELSLDAGVLLRITAYGKDAPKRPSPVRDKWADDSDYHLIE